jgi:hypothetical protein
MVADGAYLAISLSYKTPPGTRSKRVCAVSRRRCREPAGRGAPYTTQAPSLRLGFGVGDRLAIAA